MELRYKHESISLSQKLMVELFDTTTDNIGLHLKNIYSDGGLLRDNYRGFLGSSN